MASKTKEFFDDFGSAAKRANELNKFSDTKYKVLSKDGTYIVQIPDTEKISIVEKIIFEAGGLQEDVKTLNYTKTKEPLKDTDKIRVYHGFGGNSQGQALKAVKFGLSGQERADRVYSYETVNNPKGLFVTIDFKVAERQFAGSGIVIEFDTLVSNLEAPVWKGQDSYFVPGQYTGAFKDDEERTQEQLRKREKYKNEDPEGEGRWGMNKRVSKSDRPELAASLLMGGEQQALFIGNLDPNNIKYVWYHEGRFKDRTTTGQWVRMSRIDFLKNILNPFVDELKKEKKKDSYHYDIPVIRGENKFFSPNEDFTIQKLKAKLDAKGYSTDDFLKYYTKDYTQLKNHFYPKQIEQLKQYVLDNKIETI